MRTVRPWWLTMRRLWYNSRYSEVYGGSERSALCNSAYLHYYHPSCSWSKDHILQWAFFRAPLPHARSNFAHFSSLWMAWTLTYSRARRLQYRLRRGSSEEFMSDWGAGLVHVWMLKVSILSKSMHWHSCTFCTQKYSGTGSSVCALAPYEKLENV